MLRIHFLASTLLASLVSASDYAALGQRSVITARAVLPPRGLYGRQNQFTCAQATDTVCGDGSGCCPQGAACFSSSGVGLCSVTCEAAQPTCVFNSVTACCPVGDSCGGSLCIPAGMNTGMVGLAVASMDPPPTTSLAVISMSPADAADLHAEPTPGAQSFSYSVVSMKVADNGTHSDSSQPSVVVVSHTTSITTTPGGMASTATFGLGSRPSTSGPLQVSINAAPTPASYNALINLAGLAALGLAL
jgi:hypothetical protein